jgi:hypothetical protein
MQGERVPCVLDPLVAEGVLVRDPVRRAHGHTLGKPRRSLASVSGRAPKLLGSWVRVLAEVEGGRRKNKSGQPRHHRHSSLCPGESALRTGFVVCGQIRRSVRVLRLGGSRYRSLARGCGLVSGGVSVRISMRRAL